MHQSMYIKGGRGIVKGENSGKGLTDHPGDSDISIFSDISDG